MTFTLAILLAALLPQASGPKDSSASTDPPRGEISGRFVSAQTGEPLKSVSVQISAVLHGQFWRQATLTGVDGAFSFQGLPPGSYFVEGEKSGYRPRSGAGPITLEGNQSRSGIEIKLDRAAAITGRVIDPEGLPMIGANVTAYRYRWTSGRRTANPVESARADDRGVYRLFGLPAGRYVVGASAPADETPAGEADLSLTQTFYPTGARAAEAATLDVRWGQELSEINLVFRQQQTFSISGVVADTESSGPCRSCRVLAAGQEELYGATLRQFAVASDGSYRVRGLIPGAYRISAIKPRDGRHVVSSRTVQLTDRSLRDIHLVVGVGHLVTGRIVLESPPAGQEASAMYVVFALPSGMQQTCKVRPDFSFEGDALSAETYRVSLRGVPPGGYVKALRLAGRDLPGPEIEVPEEGSLSELEVVVAFDSATLSGQVKPPERTAQGHRVTAAAIVLFPQENQSPFLVERRTNADVNGSFTLSGIAPGAYTVFAFPQTETTEWEDPSVRRRLQSYGKSVDLGARKKESIDLALAPESIE